MKTVLSQPEVLGLGTLRESNTGQWYSMEADDQTMAARVYSPSTIRDERQIILDGTAYSVHASTPRDVDRTGRLAEESELLTFGLEQPGMSPYSGPLTEEQRKALNDGDWSALGRAQWKLIEQILSERGIEYSEENPITVHYAGFSQAASSNIGLIESAPAGIKTGHVVAWENTAWEKNESRIKRYKRMGELVLGVLHGGIGLRQYHKQAAPIRKEIKTELQQEVKDGIRVKVAQKLSERISAWISPIRAMAHGGDAEKLRDAILRRNEADSAVVHIWNGERSWVSRNKANKYGAGMLAAAGISVYSEHDEDGRHGVEDATLLSIPRYAEAFSSDLPNAA